MLKIPKSPFVTFIFLWLGYTSFGQLVCDGKRYKSIVFSETDVVSNVKYGEAQTVSGKNQELYFDIYSPKGDMLANRPTIILAFGGGFVSGEKEDLSVLCNFYAVQGYVVISMDYRLFDIPNKSPSDSELEEVLVQGIIDMKSVLAYIEEDARSANRFGIDTNNLFIGGISAGGILACHTAYMDSSDTYSPFLQETIRKNGEINGITNTQKTPKIKGVINYSGAILDAKWINSGDPSLISFHDEFDGVVPYRIGQKVINGNKEEGLNGSFIMDSIANKVGVNSALNTIEGSSGHVSYFSSTPSSIKVVNQSTSFLYDILCEEGLSTDKFLDENHNISLVPNPFVNHITLTFKHAEEHIVSILDDTGREIFHVSMQGSGEHTINVEEMPSGTYMVQVQNATTSYSKRIMKY